MRVRASSPRMVGRAAELSALTDALGESGMGKPTVVVVQAEAGAGKTRLVTEFVERARTSGAVTLVGGCFPLGGVSPPYAPLAQAFRSHLRTLPAEAAQTLSALLPPELVPGFGTAGAGAATGTAEQRAGLFDRMGATFATMSLSAPLVLVLEDVHWADPSTRDAVAYLVHSLSDERVLLVVTHRIDDLDRQPDLRTWLVQLRRAPRSITLPLTRLGRVDVAEQIAGITGATPDRELVDAVSARAGGNPLHVEELVAAGPPPAGQLPSTLLDTITTRFELLPEPARQLIRAAAAIGRQTSEALLCAAAGLEPHQLPGVLRPVISLHLLHPVPGELAYEFHHELVREAAYAELLPGERVAVHATIARSLAAEGNSATGATHLALLAHHWTQANDRARAVPALVAAGTAAMDSTGFAEAYDQLSRAIRWQLQSDWKPADEIAPGWDLIKTAQLAGRAALLCGETSEGRALGELVLGSLDPDEDLRQYAELTATQGVLRMLDGDTPAARAAYEQALALLPADRPTTTRATVLCRFASVCGFLGEDELAYRYAADAARMAQLLGEPALEGRAYALLALYATPYGDEQAATDMARRALTLSTASGDVEAIMSAHVALTTVAQIWGRVPDLLASAQQGLTVATRLGATSSQAASELTYRAASAYFGCGDWQRAEQLWESLLARPRDRNTAVVVAGLYMVDLRIAQGQFERAAELLPPDSALQPWGDWMLAVVDGARAELAIWQGRLDEADSAFRRAAGKKSTFRDLDPVMTGWFIGWLIATAERAVADVVQLAAATGATGADVDRVDPDALLSAWLGGQPRHPGASTLRMRAWLCMADAEHSRRDRSDPVAWTEAVAAWDDYGDMWHAAYARFRLAEALVATPGDRSGAAEPLRLAWDFCRRVGAMPLLAEIEALAKRARIPLEDPDARPAAAPKATDPHGLTEREVDVVRLIADGATNAQIATTLFISEKTAATHVSNILRKLGAARRTEAAAIAHRLGITDRSTR